MSIPKLYKVLDVNGFACHGGTGQWFLPQGKRPGKWMPKREAVLCNSGYHAVRASSLLDWLHRNDALVFLAEGRGDNHNDGSKWVFEQMRLVGPVLVWNPCVARLFACDCAERVLGIFEREQPDDLRPRQCIEVARRFANGEATERERDAAKDAAWDAAGAAAGAAAGDAARNAAWYAAEDAARNAAGYAAKAAAKAAAEAAAEDAAEDAAWNAAEDAAWNAAWNAAKAAELRWQTRQLLAYLEERVC
jgi:hypothetical protein